MPIATLTFNLPEEQAEYDLSIRGSGYHSVLWDYDQLLRQKCKYGDDEMACHFRELLWDTMKEHGIDIYEEG